MRDFHCFQIFQSQYLSPGSSKYMNPTNGVDYWLRWLQWWALQVSQSLESYSRHRRVCSTNHPACTLRCNRPPSPPTPARGSQILAGAWSGPARHGSTPGLKLLDRLYTVEFLFVNSLSCRIAQKYMHFVFSGKKMNGQIRTPLYFDVALQKN